MNNNESTIVENSSTYQYRELDTAVEANKTAQTELYQESDATKSCVFLQSVEALTSVITRETEAVRNADFTTFRRIQNEKLYNIRKVEKAAKNSLNDINELERDLIEKQIRAFSEAIDRNMKILEAMKTGIDSVKKYALKTLEDHYTDGVYEKYGTMRAPSRLSAISRDQIKL